MRPMKSTTRPLTRYACEPCRRKKTKCSAERPICSYCKRLGDRCHYLPRGQPKSDNRGLRRRLSRRTIPEAIQQRTATNSGDHHTDLTVESENSRRSDQSLHDSAPFTLQDPESPTPGTLDSPSVQQSSCIFSTTKPDPGLSVINHFVNVYKKTIHLQPLPVFVVPDIAVKLSNGPQYLRWSFMALMLQLSTHHFFHDQESTAADFYSRKAEQTVMEMASEGVPTIELVQALCLITLKHFKTGKLNRAWMTTGAASRLESHQLLSYEGPSSLRDHSQVRSYWLVHALECPFVPLTTGALEVEIPDYPDLTLMPPQPHSLEEQGSAQIGDVGSSTVGTDRVAIIAHSLSIITIWGKLRCHLHSLRQGKTEKPWSPDSVHTKINLELINFEATTPKKLFLCNAYLSQRTKDEVSRHPEYWNRFMVSQLLWHAVHATLNHPFIHLYLLASSDSIPTSCFFMQQRVDTAIYHSNWTFRLLDIFNNLMDIGDPMVADAMAGAASVSWLFQFSKDQQIAQKAKDNLLICEGFLSHVAQSWPHMEQNVCRCHDSNSDAEICVSKADIQTKVDALRKLQALAKENHRQGSNKGTTISFQPALFWDLLAPKPVFKANETHGSDLRGEAKSEISLKNHFVLPIQDGLGSDRGNAATDLDTNPFLLNPGDLELFNIDSLSHDFFQSGLWDQI